MSQSIQFPRNLKEVGRTYKVLLEETQSEHEPDALYTDKDTVRMLRDHQKELRSERKFGELSKFQKKLWTAIIEENEYCIKKVKGGHLDDPYSNWS